MRISKIGDNPPQTFCAGASTRDMFCDLSRDAEHCLGRLVMLQRNLFQVGDGMRSRCRGQRIDQNSIRCSGCEFRDQFSRIAGAGKPIFIDKPFASSVSDAEAMADLAARNGTRAFCSSALRFSTALTDVLGTEPAGSATGADFCGPMAIEPTSPGLFWYGVHTVEMLYASLGTGCRSVVAASTDEHDCLIGVWDDGRLGTIRGNRTGDNDFQGLVHFAGRTAHVDIATASRPFFSSLLDQVMSFFKGGESPVPLATSVEMVRFMEAGNRSRESGEVVSLR